MTFPKRQVQRRPSRRRSRSGRSASVSLSKRIDIVTGSRTVKLSAFCIAFISGCAFNALLAMEVMPSKPAHYFNDYAGIVSESVAEELDRQLAQFERATSNQVVVAIFPKMQS